ncbi:MAG: AraC family transcriptional regulator [Planctomycetota bacterium]
MDRGTLRVTTDGVEQVLVAGEVVCQWPGGREKYVFDPDVISTHRWVALTFSASGVTKRWLAGLRAGSPGVRVESGVMRRLFETAVSLGPADDAETVGARTHLAWAYLAAYLVGEEVSNARRLPEALRAMRDAIETRYAEPMTLDDLAKAASVSANHLVRLCRQHLDTTPMRLLWDTRVAQGVELIRGTGLTISEIAYRVGFTSPFHFSRLCKVKHGIPPRKLRVQAWANGRRRQTPYGTR